MEAQVLSKRLVDIGDVEPLNENDLPVMGEIYDVLRRHNALQRFGVTLLHEHFEVADDEVLIEMTDRKTRIQTITPVDKNSPLLVDAIETCWRLDTGFPVQACSCVKYGDDHSHQSRG
ncbi:hypothetical protein [Mucilaginibacter sp. dw_454]|uniref:hypothetical protein n=1 Tax=Mucilaginibacter sp. dw_454 TaxID=2720079 RepID=UPI001BD44596|nr:hypothetical protein [Mucilaginibacter sp. dw_454]